MDGVCVDGRRQARVVPTRETKEGRVAPWCRMKRNRPVCGSIAWGVKRPICAGRFAYTTEYLICGVATDPSNKAHLVDGWMADGRPSLAQATEVLDRRAPGGRWTTVDDGGLGGRGRGE